MTQWENKGGKVVLLTVLGLVLLCGGLYVAAYLAAGDKVPRGTTGAGVDIGGRDAEDAEKALRAGLADREDRAITVTHDGETVRLVPDEVGLAVDYAASVAAAGGEQSWDPGRLWDYWTGGDDLDAVIEADGALDALSEDAGTPARNGGIRFRDGEIVVVDPRAGETFDPEAAYAALQDAYLSDDPTMELESVPVQPEIGEAAVEEALEMFANPAMSGPVTLVFGDSPVQLQPEEFSAALGMRPEGGALVPALKEKVLVGLVDAGVSDEDAPVDATVALVDGKPKVVPAKPGVTYDPEDVSSAFLELVTRDGDDREMEVDATVAEPEFTTADARALKIKERVSTFTTYYPYAEYRNVNIGRAAELVDGTVLKPGEVFSLNDIVGERTVENGFTEGTIISDGIFKQDLGGGVSQMATTTFNAAFFAGLKDIEHKPHSFYIDRYPVGREATVAWGAVDLRFENDTPYGVLISAKVQPSTPSSQGVVTVSMYSTKHWDISTTTSDRYNYRQPATRTLTTPDCYPNSGYAGFDVDVTRVFRKPGSDEVVKTEKFHTTYIPSDTVICKKPKGA